jgi:hypothetical protein
MIGSCSDRSSGVPGGNNAAVICVPQLLRVVYLAIKVTHTVFPLASRLFVTW